MAFHLMRLKKSFGADHFYVMKTTANPIDPVQGVEPVHLAPCPIWALDWLRIPRSILLDP